MLEHVHCEQRQEQRREEGYDSTKYQEAHGNHRSVRKSRHAESGRESPRSYLTGEELGSDRLDDGRLAGNSEIEGIHGYRFRFHTRHIGMETDSCAYKGGVCSC